MPRERYPPRYDQVNPKKDRYLSTMRILVALQRLPLSVNKQTTLTITYMSHVYCASAATTIPVIYSRASTVCYLRNESVICQKRIDTVMSIRSCTILLFRSGSFVTRPSKIEWIIFLPVLRPFPSTLSSL